VNSISSQNLIALYTKTHRDEELFPLTDQWGVQIIRRYDGSDGVLSDKRMFINLYIYKDDIHTVGGNINVVSRADSASNWRIYFPSGYVFVKPTNYGFGPSENVRFDTDNDRILFKDMSYTLNQFVDLMEKNHRRDMFWLSRILNLCVFGLLYVLFFFKDELYEMGEYIFTETHSIPVGRQKKPERDLADPIFKYFDVYHNLLGVAAIVALIISVILSYRIPYNYFTVSNPVIVLSALLIMYLLDRVSAGLKYLLQTTTFARRLTRFAIEARGKLKPYKI